MTTELTFGLGVSWLHDGAELARTARRAEEQGVGVITAADHVPSTEPFAQLATVAAVTERVRLRTYVLDAYFWNPALLARAAATVDALSGGRLELGLGAGHMKSEHDDAGLPFPPHAERVAHTERVLVEVRRRLAEATPGEGATRPGLAPVQRPVPVLVGGWGERMLRLAARQADVVAFTGAHQAKGKPLGTLELAGSADTAARIALFDRLLGEERPGGPPPARDGLLQHVELGRPPEQAAAEKAAEWEVTPEFLLDTPWALFAATPEDAIAELERRRDAYGITCWCTHTPFAEQIGAIAEAYR